MGFRDVLSGGGFGSILAPKKKPIDFSAYKDVTKKPVGFGIIKKPTFQFNKILDDQEQSKALISKVFPSAPSIVEGIRTGNWDKYAAETKAHNEYLKTPEGVLSMMPGEGAAGGTRKVVKDLAADGATKVRGFVDSVRQALPQAEKVSGQYVPRSTDVLSIKAKNFIKESPEQAEQIAMSRSDESAVAIASELLKKYGDDAAKADGTAASALYDKAADIANTLAPKLTEQGRAIQAASILGRLTPEGQVRFAAREIQRFNELNPSKRIPELTGEQSRKIIEEMRAIRDMADGPEKAMRFKKLQDSIHDLVPSPLMKKIITVWKAGLLTGVKTTGLNLFSNLSHSASEVVKDAPAAVVDSVASLFTGQRTKTFTLGGSGKGIKEGFDKGLRYLKTGYDERNVAEKLDYKRVNFGTGKVGKAFQAYTDTVFGVMGATDQPFYYGALSRSLMDQALAAGKNAGKSGNGLKMYANNLIENPSSEMLRTATSEALQAVFQNDTALGKVAKAIQSIPWGIGELIVPFGKTPSAVATQIVNYSPAGIVKTIIENIGKGNFDQRAFSQGIGRGITGTGVLAIGMALAGKGLISLDRPTTEAEQKLWELEGRKANSIKIGDKWRSPTVFGPPGNLLLIGGHLQKALQKTSNPYEALASAIFGSLKSFTEQTFLTGVNKAAEALSNPERFASSFFNGLVASTIPTLVSDFSRALDPMERRAETAVQSMQARIPGARQTLEPQVDVLGRERASIGNPLEIMADPTRPSPDTSTPVVSELRRLFDAGYKVSPTLLGDKKGFSVLSQEQNTELWKLAGSITNDKLTSLFASPAYQKLDDEAKSKIVDKFVDQSKISARVAMVIELTQGLKGEQLKAKLSELKASGFLTKEVFKKYTELR